MANWANAKNVGDPLSPGWRQKNLKWIEPVKGQQWEVYAPAAAAFEGLINDLVKLGYSPTSSGGYNYRNKRGGTSLSQHAYGTAIDLNSMTNKMGQRTTDIPQAAELAKKWGLDWGGNWKRTPDPMHFEYQGTSPQAIGAQMVAAGYSPEQVKKAFLDTIASTEATGYDVLYGGTKFTDFSQHPGRAIPIFDTKRPGLVVNHSTAAGRYQFLKDTWAEQAKKYGYKDFSPETQDTAAWNYANDIFKQKGGGDLMEALSSNDPARQNAAAQILNQTWTSLPGGKEQAKGYGNQTFADVYAKNLGAAPVAASTTTSTTGGGTADTATASPKKKGFDWGKFAEGFGDMAAPAGNAPMPYQSQPTPAPSVASAPATPMVNPEMQQMQRERLAQVLAMLQGGGYGQVQR